MEKGMQEKNETVLGICPFCPQDGEDDPQIEFNEALYVESINGEVREWLYSLSCCGCYTTFSVSEEGDMLDLRDRLKIPLSQPPADGET